MDFAPMNMRMAVPHANDVGEIQHNLNQQAALQQDFKAEQHKKLIERQQNQVRTKDEAEGEKIKDNPDRKQGRRQQQARGRRKSPKEIMEEQEALEAPEEPSMAVDQYRGRSIDISC